ncbi:hypothetical protein [Oricola sp.]|uniref:hypothetical protein n=1 Tax=Oricola sp. TaxID=1979950 RepID=UPI0025E96A93|nr:hypothetical protein [Oricola sp.]MCI5073448.1 hypothetical protein [Oricola sp.]
MSATNRTSLAGRIEQRLSANTRGTQPTLKLDQVQQAAERWQARRAAEPSEISRRRMREIAQLLKDGLGAELPLSDIRKALLNMREDDAFRTSTIARHRLISEAIERPGKTPVNILFSAFFHSFEKGSPETDRIYEHLRRNEPLLRISSREFAHKSKFFQGDYGLDTIIDSVDLLNPVRSLARLGMKEEVQDSLYGVVIKCALIERTLTHVDLDPMPLKTILGWIELGDKKRAFLESAYYEILLARFVAKDPSPDVKRTIARFLLGHFGDPRSTNWPKLREDTGRLKRDVCIAVMERWLDSGLLQQE